jgi:hypothetical protein
VAASKKFGWKSPLAMNSGNTQDISKFRFHIWEPIWYFHKCKAPEDPWKKARWLGFADSSGDEMCYYIKTETTENPHYLIRSVICTRRKNIGTEKEYINEDSSQQPEVAELELGFLNKFQQTISSENKSQDGESHGPVDMNSGEMDLETQHQMETESSETGELASGELESGELVSDLAANTKDAQEDHTTDLDETLPAEMKGDPNEVLEDLFNDMEMQDDDYQLDVIVDHSFRDGMLILKARYYSNSTETKDVWETPFNIIKKDAPIEVAKYISNNVVETSRRNGYYGNWARNTLKHASRSIKRLHRLYNVHKTYRVNVARRSAINRRLDQVKGDKETVTPDAVKKKLSRNARNKKKGAQEKFGIKIPQTAREALLLDKGNKNNKWAEAILKEMSALD